MLLLSYCCCCAVALVPLLLSCCCCFVGLLSCSWCPVAVVLVCCCLVAVVMLLLSSCCCSVVKLSCCFSCVGLSFCCCCPVVVVLSLLFRCCSVSNLQLLQADSRRRLQDQQHRDYHSADTSNNKPLICFVSTLSKVTFNRLRYGTITFVISQDCLTIEYFTASL